MKRIAVIFSQSPHGSATGREGLDALLAIAGVSDNTDIFFISDGVMHLLSEQQPKKINARDYIATFGLLSLYGIEQCYVCKNSLSVRNIQLVEQTSIPKIIPLSPKALRQRLEDYTMLLTF